MGLGNKGSKLLPYQVGQRGLQGHIIGRVRSKLRILENENKNCTIREQQEIIRRNEVLQRYEIHKGAIQGAVLEDAKFEKFKEKIAVEFVCDKIFN